MIVLRALPVAVVLASFSAVRAQTSPVTCPSNLSYLMNNKGQTPCLIAAYLEENCVTDGSSWNVPALSPGLSYIGPHSNLATYCSCSSVVYSLTSACAACQNHTWISWSNWIVNCTQQTTTLRTYPLDIPVGTSVPAWAYNDVATFDTFNLSLAAVNTAAPSTYFGTPTASINYHISSQSASLIVSFNPSSSSGAAAGGSNKGGSKTNAGAIVGGVIGGLIVLTLIGVIIWLLLKRNKNARGGRPPSPTVYYAGDEHEMTKHPSGIDYGAAYRDSPTLFSESSQPTTVQKLYDPSDPSTFPQTPASFAYQSTSDGMSQSLNMSHGQTIPSGKYTGAAEV